MIRLENVTDAHQAFADDINQVLYARTASATPIEIMSTRGGKTLELVEEQNGARFIRRSFNSEFLDHLHFHYGLDFMTAWDEMHEAMSSVGINIVPSHVLEASGVHPFTVISEYLEDARQLKVASTEAKKAVASALGSLLTSDLLFIPSLEMLMPDMFMVSSRDGQQQVFLTDVDPLMAPERVMRQDINSAAYITKLAGLFWDCWSSEEERQGVMSTLVSVLGDYALDGFPLESSTGKAFMDLHLMSNGVDVRNA